MGAKQPDTVQNLILFEHVDFFKPQSFACELSFCNYKPVNELKSLYLFQNIHSYVFFPGPLKRVKKLYFDDETLPVPRSTHYWRQIKRRKTTQISELCYEKDG